MAGRGTRLTDSRERYDQVVDVISIQGADDLCSKRCSTRCSEAAALEARSRHDQTRSTGDVPRRLRLGVLAVVAYAALTSPRSRPASVAERGRPHVEFIASVPDGPLILFRDASPGAAVRTAGRGAAVAARRAPPDCAAFLRARPLRGGMGRVHGQRRDAAAGAPSRLRLRSLVPDPSHHRR